MNITEKKPNNVPDSVPIPDKEFYDDLEWTQEEEEEFLKIISEDDIGDWRFGL